MLIISGLPLLIEPISSESMRLGGVYPCLQFREGLNTQWRPIRCWQEELTPMFAKRKVN